MAAAGAPVRTSYCASGGNAAASASTAAFFIHPRYGGERSRRRSPALRALSARPVTASISIRC